MDCHFIDATSLTQSDPSDWAEINAKELLHRRFIESADRLRRRDPGESSPTPQRILRRMLGRSSITFSGIHVGHSVSSWAVGFSWSAQPAGGTVVAHIVIILSYIPLTISWICVVFYRSSSPRGWSVAGAIRVHSAGSWHGHEQQERIRDEGQGPD